MSWILIGFLVLVWVSVALTFLLYSLILSSPPLGIIGLAVILVPSLYLFIWRPAHLRRAQQRAVEEKQRLNREASERRAAEEARLEPIRKAKALEEQRSQLIAQAQWNADRAVVSFKSLTEWLANARSWYLDAQGHFSEHAASPFWTSIEMAYTQLAGYSQALNSVEKAGMNHCRLLDDFKAAGGSAQDFPAFPIDLDSVRASVSATSASERLGALVYSAQKLDRFDTIWEQRRTTAAVITGFGRIENAISTMSRTLGDGIFSLTQSVRVIGDAQVRAQGAVTDAIAATNNAVAINGKPTWGVTSGAQAEVRAAAAQLSAITFGPG